jgi:hypothetical protein
MFNHALQDFFRAVFAGNIGYVNWDNMLLGIPQGLLIVKCLVLIVGIALLVWQRKRVTTQIIFTSLWLLFSLFNTFFSERPYTHYVIVLLPSFCLLIGLFCAANNIKSRLSTAGAFIIILFILCSQFQFNFTKSYLYYSNAIQFVTGQKDVTTYQSFFDPNTPRDYALASFITHNTTATEKVFVWGDSPQIYALAHKLPLGKYTVAYHITENDAISQTQQEINKQRPTYIIALQETQLLPFALPLYIMRYKIPGATIYERSF